MGAGSGAVGGGAAVATIISGVGTAGSTTAFIQSAIYGPATMGLYATAQSAVATGTNLPLAGMGLAGAAAGAVVFAAGGAAVGWGGALFQ